MSKTLVFINGVPGVGKSTISNQLLKRLNNAFFLDGDWCWMMNPWNFTDENKSLVEDNIIHILNNYLQHSSYQFIIFSWVMHKETIINSLINKLDTDDVKLFKFTISANASILKERMIKDGRNQEQITSSINKLNFYENMNTIKIDTSKLNVIEAVNKIEKIIFR